MSYWHYQQAPKALFVIPQTFNTDNSVVCQSNSDVEKVMIKKDPIDHSVVVTSPSVKVRPSSPINGKEEFEVRPIGVYSNYLGSYTVETDGTILSLTQKIGFEKPLTEVPLSFFTKAVSGCDATLQVTTGFGYSSLGIASPSTESQYQVTLDQGTYHCYQTAIVYASLWGTTDNEKYKEFFEKESIEYRLDPEGKKIYTLCTIYCNQMIVKPHTEDTKSPVEFDDFVNYLFTKGYSKWAKDF